MTKRYKLPVIKLIVIILIIVFTRILNLVSFNSVTINQCINLFSYSIYIFFLLYWGYTIKQRVLSAHIKDYLLIINSLLVYWMTVRTLKFIPFTDFTNMPRYLWYNYYVAMILVPVFLLFIGVSFGQNDTYRPRKRYHYLLLIGTILIVLTLTNDYHNFVFIFQNDKYDYNNYKYNWGFFVIAFWTISLASTSLYLLFKKSYKLYTRKKLFIPFTSIVLAIIYAILYAKDSSITKFGFIDATLMYIFLIILFAESSIMIGLVLTNTNYQDFFANSKINATIIDDKNKIRYVNKASQKLSDEVIEHLKLEKIYQLNEDTLVKIKEINGGYIIWEEDLSQLNLLIEELSSIKDQLVNKAELLNEQIDLKRKKIAVNEKNRLLDLSVLSVKKQISQLKTYLSLIDKDLDVDKNKLLAKINFLGVYIKRRSNFVLESETKNKIKVYDFKQSFKESLNNLQLYDINSVFIINDDSDIDYLAAISMFDFYQNIVEESIDFVKNLVINFNNNKKYLFAIRLESNLNLTEVVDIIKVNSFIKKHKEQIFFDLENKCTLYISYKISKGDNHVEI